MGSRKWQKNDVQLKFKEIMAVNFQELINNTNFHSQEVQWFPSKAIRRKSTIRLLLIKLQKAKQREVLRVNIEKKKKNCLQRAIVSLTSDFSAVTMKAKRYWDDI